MTALLRIAVMIDALNECMGRIACWLVLVACVISAGNAMMRYGFSISSNAWLEIQWYPFGGIVMLGAAHTLRINQHVRVDVLYASFTPRTKHAIDVLADFLSMAFCVIVIWLSIPGRPAPPAPGQGSSRDGGRFGPGGAKAHPPAD